MSPLPGISPSPPDATHVKTSHTNLCPHTELCPGVVSYLLPPPVVLQTLRSHQIPHKPSLYRARKGVLSLKPPLQKKHTLLLPPCWRNLITGGHLLAVGQRYWENREPTSPGSGFPAPCPPFPSPLGTLKLIALSPGAFSWNK